MKPLLIVLAVLFAAGCTTVVDKRTYIKVVNCKSCAPAMACPGCAPPPCVGCAPAPRPARCAEGRIQGDFGQTFRVECPGGRVVPDVR